MKIERTALNINQISHLKDVTYDEFKDELATTIRYEKFNGTTPSHSIYREAKDKEYETAIILYAIVVLDPSPEFLEEIGVEEEKVDGLFTLIKKELDDNSITITKKDVIEYKSIDYDITNIIEYGQTIKGENFLVRVTGVKSVYK